VAPDALIKYDVSSVPIRTIELSTAEFV
jgi:hypothetical protein